MQSGKIAPIFKQFFREAVSTKSATDSNSQNNQNAKKEPEREPTKEETLEALDLLTQQEEFQKNSLRAELKTLDERFAILVFNASGAQLKVIRGPDIHRILQAAALGHKGPSLGRILDRRI